MDENNLSRELTAIDDKLRALETEVSDHALDVASRVRNLREHVEDVQDELKTRGEG